MVQIENESTLLDAIKDVRNDATETNWCLAGHVENNPEKVRFAGSGSGGLDELVAGLDESAVMYGFLRLTQKFDLSVTVKFVYIYFIGGNVPALQRGKIGTVHGEIDKIFHPYHIDFEITHPNEISTELIEKKLAETSGQVNKVKEVDFENPHQRGFTSSSQVSGGAKKSAFGFQGQSGTAQAGEGIPAEGNVKEAIGDVRSDKTETNWMLATYQDNDVKKPLVLVAKGNGGVDELSSNLTGEMVAYGLIRIVDMIEGIKTIKFVFILYIGGEVSIMKKAKVSTHKGGIDSLFSPYHVSSEVSSPSDLSDQGLLNLVQEASGSKSKVK